MVGCNGRCFIQRSTFCAKYFTFTALGQEAGAWSAAPWGEDAASPASLCIQDPGPLNRFNQACIYFLQSTIRRFYITGGMISMKGYQRLAAAEAAFDRISGLPDRDAALDAAAAWSLMEEGAGPALELAVLRREVLAAMTTPLTLDEVGVRATRPHGGAGQICVEPPARGPGPHGGGKGGRADAAGHR